MSQARPRGPIVIDPRKFLASLEHKREAAAALARTLDRLGEHAATYAEVCRSPETDELLCAWEAEDPAASQRLRDLLDRSGIEPPDKAERPVRSGLRLIRGATIQCTMCG